MNTVEQLRALAPDLEQVMASDRGYLHGRYQRLLDYAKQDRLQAEPLAEFATKLLASHQRFLQRQQQVPARIELNQDLPVSQHAEQILAHLQQHQVLVLAGETGSGKTTQLPKLCLMAGRGRTGLIGHTQPRRLAARTVAQRLAQELQSPLGELVGYSVRFDDRLQADSLIRLMTDGILLAEIQQDPLLKAYDTLIIDEAHERSLNIDFLLGYLKQLLPKRPDLRLIITSATIDTARFAEHFAAPVLEIPGRSYPVDLHYWPDEPDELELSQRVLAGVEQILHWEAEGQTPSRGGDILVFLPGEADIRDCHKRLKEANLRQLEILPLYARLSASEQQRIFNPGKGRRLVLSTNVAETSVTVPGIAYVIDSGLARISRYSARSKVQRLPIEAISQASANQRAGRCGRVSHGLCLRLYSEEDFARRPAFTEPEILRTNLAAVILQMLQLRLGQVDQFPFIDPPDGRMIKDGYQLLYELQAVDERNQITALGKQLARLPIDPRLGRMLVAAKEQHCLDEVLIVVSSLAAQDVRERPANLRPQADQAHAVDKDPESDFASLIKLWHRLQQQWQDLGSNAMRRWCQKNFINYLRLREWRELHRQMLLACKQQGLSLNSSPASYAQLHTALAAGLLSQVAMWQEQRQYLTARNRQCVIFPGSNLAKRSPKWLIAAEMVETSELFARYVARIEPEWLEPLAQHLVKKHYSEPSWQQKRGQVMALESQKLYGLPIIAGRKVNFAKIDPPLAREIFIRQALVEQQYQQPPAALRANWQLIREIEDLENRQRRRDLLVDDELLFAFYDQRLPADICNSRSFAALLKQQPQLIRMSRENLLAQQADFSAQHYPDQLQLGRLALPLDYQFQPGKEEDGITLTVPIGALRQLPPEQLDWLVPGALKDKCIAMIKALPKQLRKTLVPVPDLVEALLPILPRGEMPLTQALSKAIYQLKQVRIAEQEWDTSRLPEHHRLRIKVVNASGEVVKTGRDLLELKAQLDDVPVEQLVVSSDHSIERSGLTSWHGSALPETYQYQQAGFSIQAYPALVPEGKGLAIKLFDHQQYAWRQHQQGLVRWARLSLPEQEKYLQQQIPNFKQAALYFAPFGQAQALMEDLLQAAFMRVFAADWRQLPRCPQAFAEQLQQGRAQVIEQGLQLGAQLEQILALHHRLAKQLKGKVSLVTAFMFSDIKAQLAELIYPGFISKTPPEWFEHLPRYLQACDLRLNRASGINAREQHWVEQLRQYQLRYQQRLNEQQKVLQFDPELEKFRWLLEEYRVSLFAQSLGTSEPVSDKRLEKQWQLVS